MSKRKKLTRQELQSIIKEEIQKFVQEQEKWAQDVDVEEGKMKSLLGIPEDETIVDNYDSGKQLASDLVDALNGDQDEAASMLAFAANVDPEENVLDDALQALEDM